MRKLTKIILPEVGVGDLKIRPRGDNRCESANCRVSSEASLIPSTKSLHITPHDRMVSEVAAVLGFVCAGIV
jgi:hypothetical protein